MVVSPEPSATPTLARLKPPHLVPIRTDEPVSEGDVPLRSETEAGAEQIRATQKGNGRADQGLSC